MKLRNIEKKWWYVAGILVIVVFIAWAGIWNRGAMNVAEPSVSPTPTSGISTQKAGTTAYTKAVQTYANVRFQFDQYCQAIPQSMSVKSGRTIMLDNRSGDARVIKVGPNSYSLAGYGWRLVTVSSTTLPKTLYLNCGSAVNVGTLILNK